MGSGEKRCSRCDAKPGEVPRKRSRRSELDRDRLDGALVVHDGVPAPRVATNSPAERDSVEDPGVRAAFVSLLGGVLAGLTPAGPVGGAAWPEEAWLWQALPEASGQRPVRLYLDAGHGSGDNTGNLSALCEPEERFTLSLATDVAETLRATGAFLVLVSRGDGGRPTYRERVDEATAWGAELLVSLHSDVRGRASEWSPEPGQSCPRSRHAPGFSVLTADEGDDALARPRRRFALALGSTLRRTGFLPYDGKHYSGDYELVDRSPGVFRERSGRDGIFMLRATTMPSVVIETHHALDDREARRFREPETRRAFAGAVGRAALQALR